MHDIVLKNIAVDGVLSDICIDGDIISKITAAGKEKCAEAKEVMDCTGKAREFDT